MLGGRPLSRRWFVRTAGMSAACLLAGSAVGCTGSKSGGESSGSNTSRSQITSTENSQAGNDRAATIFLTTGMVCVTEYAANTLAVVDAQAGAVVHRIPVGENPVTMALGSGVLYVGSSGGGEVRVVPLRDAANSFAIPVGTQPLGLCFDEGRQFLYVADYFSSCVHVVDAALHSAVRVMSLPDEGFHGRTDPPDCCRVVPGKGRRTVSLALSPDGTTLYCANYGTYDVATLSVDTGQDTGVFDGVVGPRNVMVSPDGAHLLLAGVGGEERERVSSLYVLDRQTGERVREVPVGAAVSSVGLSADGASVFALSRDEGHLAIFDAFTWEETARCPLTVGVDSLAVSADGSQLFVVNSETGVLFVVDSTTLLITGEVAGLANPKDVVVIP